MAESTRAFSEWPTIRSEPDASALIVRDLVFVCSTLAKHSHPTPRRCDAVTQFWRKSEQGCSSVTAVPL
jgi:hypothetical protein